MRGLFLLHQITDQDVTLLWGKSSSSYWNPKSWKVLKQILLQNVTKILKEIRVWALFYPFKILVDLTLLYCEAACWNLLGQKLMYLMLHRYKQRPRDLYFQISRCFNILDIPRLVKCLVWNWDKILQNSPSLDRPLYTPNGVHNVRYYFIYFTITRAKNVIIILHLHISIMFFVCWPNITF